MVGRANGNVDHHFEQLLAAKLITDQHPGDRGAHEDVDRSDQHA